ncbi:TKL protein kinase [Phytophthora cinnamomi]|uniref:TKL protein kinase n=1 Tax=Phytophthora cinnamomi TaxID=4785 RepID=UPI00355A0FF2|nr:TKL protein kinase [Phytophthora cinnamomi]
MSPAKSISMTIASESVSLLVDPCSDRNVENANPLVENEVHNDPPDEEGLTPLIADGGVDLCKSDEEGNPPLIVASIAGHRDIVSQLLENGDDIDIDMTGKDGNTPLICAARIGHLEMVSLLLENGAAVDLVNWKGATALISAAGGGYSDTVEVLVEKGADINQTDEEGYTALTHAALGGFTGVVKLLLDKGAEIDKAEGEGDTPLMYAAYEGQLDVVKFLLKKGAEVNSASKTEGFTALLYTAEKGYVDIAKTLLENGADIEKAKKNGFSPLMMAARVGKLEFTKFLLGSGAEINRTDNEGYTALTHAALSGRLDIVKLLLGEGAEIDKAEVERDTPMMYAAYEGHFEVVRFLLDQGAKVDSSSKTEGFTALLYTAEKNFMDIARLLLEHGAEVDKSKTSDFAPLSMAAYFGHLDFVQFLLDNGAVIDKTDNEGTRVVVKTVTVVNEKESRTFHREARIWQKARHPNIVPFFGACDESSMCFFVCEEAKNGKLLDYLYHAREEGRSLVWRKLLDAALGLHFLHERHIVHSDLKCNQILVSKDGVAMLTDFGLSFLTTEQSGDEETVGAIRWKAPEVIRKDKPVAPNAQSDVYSFGMCVVEAVTSDVPWGQRVPDPVVKFHVTRQKFMPRPKAFVNDAQWELVLGMCAFDPSERMKLSDAIEVIRSFAEEERFQERLQAMKEAGDDLSDIGIGVKNLAKLPKMTMGSVRVLTKMQSIGRAVRAKRGVGKQVLAA